MEISFFLFLRERRKRPCSSGTLRGSTALAYRGRAPRPDGCHRRVAWGTCGDRKPVRDLADGAIAFEAHSMGASADGRGGFKVSPSSEGSVPCPHLCVLVPLMFDYKPWSQQGSFHPSFQEEELKCGQWKEPFLSSATASRQSLNSKMHSRPRSSCLNR